MTNGHGSRVIVYHGTDLITSLRIAKSGSILTPRERELESLKEAYLRSPAGVLQSMKGLKVTTLEEMATLIAKGKYNDREQERAMSIYVDTVLSPSVTRAMQHEGSSGGVVLGIEADEKLEGMIRSLGGRWIYAIPSRIDLSGLKEVRLTPRAKDSQEQVKVAFDKYNPKYLNL